MTTTLGKRGQIVIPQDVRVRCQLKPGDDFAVSVQGHQIVLEKILRRTYPARLVKRKGKLPVFVLPKEAPPMDPERIKAEADNLLA